MGVGAKKKPGWSRNSMLNDDVLSQILTKVIEKEDRKAFSEVCKQWLSVERLTRTSLWLSQPMFPLVLLTRFPNLVDFRTVELTKLRKRPNKKSWYYPDCDNRLEEIAKSCPKLETFVVITDKSSYIQKDGLLGPKGLRALGDWCPKLATLVFEGIYLVGDVGLNAFLNSSRNLRRLCLFGNYIISDQAFRAIASSSISSLELCSCYEISDVGLGFLANGSISKILKKLIIECCNRITDAGIQHLVKMSCLEHLELTYRPYQPFDRVGVTDVGGEAISRIQSLRELRLSDVRGFSDATVVALAENCPNLEVLALCCGQENGGVTAAGIRALSSHQCLKHLALFDVRNLGESDVMRIVFGCPSLESLVVDESLASSFEWIRKNNDDARRVVKSGSYASPLPHFRTTRW